MLHYQSGEEVLPGDRIQYAGRRGRVLFVIGWGDFSRDQPKTSEAAWFVKQYQSGLMLDAEGFGNVFIGQPDEDLVFLQRESRRRHS